MKDANQMVRWTMCALGLWLGSASPVVAQDDPEAGDVAPAASGQVEGSWQPPSGSASVDTSADADIPDDAPSAAPGDSDHAGMVGRLGVGFFGVASLPIMGCDLGAPLCAAQGNTTLSAPTVGARYWLSEQLGVEAAIGLNISSGTVGPIDTSNFGFALHGGVPLALAHSGHFVFQVVPQINFGIATGSFETGGAVSTTADTSGLVFEIGAKAGAEIHFGFIDIPQLSLQGTVGLMLRSESREVETTTGGTTVNAEQSQLTIGTGVDGEPWDIFTGAITAIYYL